MSANEAKHGYIVMIQLSGETLWITLKLTYAEIVSIPEPR